MIEWSVRNRAGVRLAGGTETDQQTAWTAAGEATIALDEHGPACDTFILTVGDEQAWAYPGTGGRPGDISFRELIEDLVHAGTSEDVE